jgi:hypothetical protein
LKPSRSLILILFLSIFMETFLNFSFLGSVFDVVHQASFFRGVILNFFWWNLANVFLVVVTVSLAFIEKERTIWRAKSISSMEKQRDCSGFGQKFGHDFSFCLPSVSDKSGISYAKFRRKFRRTNFSRDVIIPVVKGCCDNSALLVREMGER